MLRSFTSQADVTVCLHDRSGRDGGAAARIGKAVFVGGQWSTDDAAEAEALLADTEALLRYGIREDAKAAPAPVEAGPDPEAEEQAAPEDHPARRRRSRPGAKAPGHKETPHAD